jgi:hypothetical protein
VAGPVPLVATALSGRDHLGTAGARTGLFRNNYKIIPGLYGVGRPQPGSPVLVTANYKLSFDALRRELTGIDAWILVIDTRGVNVWCAAGKKTFSDAEIAFQVRASRLAEIVSHRELILPQLGAVGVAAGKLHRACGFTGIFGPIRASDLPAFLHRNKTADETMRTITFSIGERAVLIPVEVCLLWKPLSIAIAVLFLVSGIGPGFYSIAAAGSRGLMALAASLLAIVSGAVLTPLLLPWIPGRQFWFKGVLAAGLTVLPLLGLTGMETGFTAGLALALWMTSVSSYLAMNFTGSTPYTSLSGVGLEMRKGLAVQIGGAVMALILWIGSAFI